MKTAFLVIIIFLTLILIFIGAILIRKYIIKAADNRIGAYQSDLLEKHFEEVENMYRQTRGWRHDYRNHIQTMKAYLAMNEIKKLENYLDELDTDLTTVDTVIKTGNVMIDAILNSKISLAKAKNIQVDAKAIVPRQLNMSEVDLSIIVGNLMDNAIEACEKQETDAGGKGRFIRLYSGCRQGMLLLTVENSFNGELKLLQGNLFPATTKPDGEAHGIGLHNIRAAAERYRGGVSWEADENRFTLTVLLYS